MKRLDARLAFVAGSLLIASPCAFAGRLDRWEESATGEKEEKTKPPEDPPPRPHHTHVGYGYYSRADAADNSEEQYTGAVSMFNDAAEEDRPHVPGEALMSQFRLDVTHHAVGTGIEALDCRAEYGDGPLAVSLDTISYQEQGEWGEEGEEESPPDELSITQVYLLGRGYGTAHSEIGLGLGAMFVDGNEQNAGLAVTLPVLIYPADAVGIELRPALAFLEEPVLDCDIGVAVGWRYAWFRAGYRWMSCPGESLDGPYVGFSLRL